MAPLNDLKRPSNLHAPAEKRYRMDERVRSSKYDHAPPCQVRLPNDHPPTALERKSLLTNQSAQRQLDALHGKGRAANVSQLSVEELLRTPLTFVPATYLTTEVEKRLSRVDNPPLFAESKSDEKNRLEANGTSKHFAFQTEWPQPSRPSQGLFNPGNLCYRRSVLQALLHLPAFVHWIGGNHSHIKPTEPQKSSGKRHSLSTKSSNSACLACALRSLSYEYWHNPSKSALHQALRDFDRAVSSIGPNSTPKWSATGTLTQADAHEFLYWMLQVLENKRNKPTYEISQLFKLTHRGIWTCPSCRTNHTSQPGNETGLVLGLTHPQRGLPLEDYVDAYYQTRIDGLRCDKCKWTGTATRRTEIIGPGPHVLFVQLRRFERIMRMPGKGLSDGRNGRSGGKSRNGGHGSGTAGKRGLLAAVTAAYAGGSKGGSMNRKISGPVPYEYILDLGRYAARGDDVGPIAGANQNGDLGQASSESSLRYRLSSIVAHAGMLNDGHYTLIASRPGSSNAAGNGNGNGSESSSLNSTQSGNSSIHKKNNNNDDSVVVNLDDEIVSRVRKGDLLDPPGGFTPYILTYVRM